MIVISSNNHDRPSLSLWFNMRTLLVSSEASPLSLSIIFSFSNCLLLVSLLLSCLVLVLFTIYIRSLHHLLVLMPCCVVSKRRSSSVFFPFKLVRINGRFKSYFLTGFHNVLFCTLKNLNIKAWCILLIFTH